MGIKTLSAFILLVPALSFAADDTDLMKCAAE